MLEEIYVSRHFLLLQHGIDDVKQHKWFKGLDWDAVLQRKLVVCAQTLQSLSLRLTSSLVSHISPSSLVSHIISPSSLVSHISPSSLVSHISPSSLVSHISPSSLVSHISPSSLVSHISPSSLVSHINPSSLVSHISPSSLVSHISPSSLVSHISPSSLVSHIITLSPPQPYIIPRVSHQGDTRNFERYPEDGWFNVPPLRDSDIVPFKDF